MRRSEFDRAVADEFGGNGDSIVVDLALGGVGWQTAEAALASGVPAREVWLALCAEMDVPEQRRYGVGRLDPRER